LSTKKDTPAKKKTMTGLMLDAVTNKATHRHGKNQTFNPSIPWTNTWTTSSSLPEIALEEKK
jgi:hypothetical protein